MLGGSGSMWAFKYEGQEGNHWNGLWPDVKGVKKQAVQIFGERTLLKRKPHEPAS